MDSPVLGKPAKISYTKVGRLTRFPEEHINAWIRANTVEPVALNWATVALCRSAGNGATLAQLEFTLDWKNHFRYSDEEILSMLRSLERKGIAVRRDGLWFYDESRYPRGKPFIF